MSFGGIVVDILLFLIILGNAMFNYKRGLVKVVFNIFSSIIAIILVLILYKPTTDFIINNTSLDDRLENMLETKLDCLFDLDSIQSIDKNDENSMNSIIKVFVGDTVGEIIENTTDNIAQIVSDQISYKIISVVSFLLLFVIIRIILIIIKGYADILSSLPIIRTLNSSGGMVYGIVRGFLIIYVLFAIISLILPIINGEFIASAIQNSFIGSKMFNNNILLNIIFKFI